MNPFTGPFLPHLFAVTFKELRDFSRDRRTFWLTLLTAPLLYPLLFILMSQLTTVRTQTQLHNELVLPVVGAEYAPNLLAFLASRGIKTVTAGEDIEQRIVAQQEDFALRIAHNFGQQWHAGKPAMLEIITDTTRRTHEIQVARLRSALAEYGQTTGALRLLVRGINPEIMLPVTVNIHDLATPQAQHGLFLSLVLPLILMLFAFIGGSHLAMDSTAGERERQSLEPLLATPIARSALVSGKMLAAVLLGLASMLLIVLSFKLSASLGPGMARALDVSFSAMARLLAILLPLTLIGTALLTCLSASAKSIKEAQSHMIWLMLLPMLPGNMLMAWPLKDTALWQYAVPFLSQNQMLVKVTRGEVPTLQQWFVYLGASMLLAAALWALTVWRYQQEQLAISG